MRRIAANYIFPLTSKPLKNGIIEIDGHGKILDIIDTNGTISESRNLEFYNGVLVPGFVNTHCHLELSELKNVLEEKRGLPFFIQQMIEYRKQSKTNRTFQAIKDADELMAQNGIVAVGDIVNTNTTIETKRNSKIYYHSFVEISGLGTDYRERFNAAKKLYDEFFEQGLASSIVPHAPYSVSVDLFRLIKDEAVRQGSILSIHNQESKDENELFLLGTGNLLKTFKNLGIDLSSWKVQGKTSLRTIIDYLPTKNHLLFVHNLYSTVDEIQQVSKTFPHSFFVFCPLSNLFIENKLPDINSFLDFSDKITLGTDSLASNKSLSILNEMKKINKAYPTIAFEKLLQWASLNGAKALNIDHHYGSLEKGKAPGINLISDFDFDVMQITENSAVKRVV
ncbi:MAG: aminodeoxyfutalosine deaminase [Bacteroidales bacterium]|jgi:cytosine/adenosine deaminase-related metal-dependent hydrolase|nr:aminodeoxyfutalosine deaminase [Bacteroidales bacterium]